jgi:hypothetical protein
MWKCTLVLHPDPWSVRTYVVRTYVRYPHTCKVLLLHTARSSIPFKFQNADLPPILFVVAPVHEIGDHIISSVDRGVVSIMWPVRPCPSIVRSLRCWLAILGSHRHQVLHAWIQQLDHHTCMYLSVIAITYEPTPSYAPASMQHTAACFTDRESWQKKKRKIHLRC